MLSQFFPLTIRFHILRLTYLSLLLRLAIPSLPSSGLPIGALRVLYPDIL